MCYAGPVPRVAFALRSIALAIWAAGGFSTFLATSAIFGRAESRKQAADFAGAVLARSLWFRLFAVATQIVALLLGVRGIANWFALGAAVLTASESTVQQTVRRMRRELGGSVDALDPKDPRRRRFGALHGLAMLLLLGQVLLGTIGLVLQ
jgi:hypothetical protein